MLTWAAISAARVKVMGLAGTAIVTAALGAYPGTHARPAPTAGPVISTTSSQSTASAPVSTDHPVTGHPATDHPVSQASGGRYVLDSKVPTAASSTTASTTVSQASKTASHTHLSTGLVSVRPQAPVKASTVRIATAAHIGSTGPVTPEKPAPKAAPVVTPKPADHHSASGTTLTAYPNGQTGYDVSNYQCSNMPGPAGISIVQVSGGSLTGSPNSCYVQQAHWAGKNLSSYIYMNGYSGPTAQAYAYGYNAARHWVDYSRSVHVDPKLWWLDIEAPTTSGWTTVASNDQVISGAVAGLRSENVQAGLYSTPGQWQSIAGNLSFPGIPLWVPGAGNLSGPGFTATHMCAENETFAGGKLVMVQFGYPGAFEGAWPGTMTYDQDLACS